MNKILKFALAALIPIALIAASVLFMQNSGSDSFMPHSHCYMLNKKLINLHGVSDLFIGLAYVAISATLTLLVIRSRRDLPFHWMMLSFALFIVACGATHFMELWTLHSPNPRYWLSGWVKVVTAIASVVTAVILPFLVPKIREVLQSAKFAQSRKEELEKAYAELSELYNRAIAGQPVRVNDGPASEELRIPGGENLAMVAREVSDHARDLAKAKESAESANKAKDQFLAVLSHELRTPLTPALAAASNLENADQIDPAELKESLATIRRNIELEARLVDDLLDLTRISKGKLHVHFSTIDIHEAIRHALEMCKSETSAKGNIVTVELKASERHVRGDGARMAQVFWNLLLNAVKFTPSQGTLHISTTNHTATSICIAIQDSGIGIEPDMLARIFDPFQQGEESITRRYGGLGLGLSVAKALVEAHGGKITAESKGKGSGSKFSIELDITTPPPAPNNSQSDSIPANKSKLRVLLVEDHADTRCALERLLKRWGHEVQSASTVAQATELFANYEADLLLSDIGLPDGTGMELLGALRSRREIKAIAMSGYGMEADLEMTRHAGFSEHLIKPVSAERLKDSLARMIAAGV